MRAPCIFIEVLSESGDNLGWCGLHEDYEVFPKILLYSYNKLWVANEKSAFLSQETRGSVITFTYILTTVGALL